MSSECEKCRLHFEAEILRLEQEKDKYDADASLYLKRWQETLKENAELKAANAREDNLREYWFYRSEDLAKQLNEIRAEVRTLWETVMKGK